MLFFHSSRSNPHSVSFYSAGYCSAHLYLILRTFQPGVEVFFRQYLDNGVVSRSRTWYATPTLSSACLHLGVGMCVTDMMAVRPRFNCDLICTCVVGSRGWCWCCWWLSCRLSGGVKLAVLSLASSAWEKHLRGGTFVAGFPSPVAAPHYRGRQMR